MLRHFKKHHRSWVGFLLACVAIALIVNIIIAAPAMPAIWAALAVTHWQLICSAAVALAALGSYAGYRAFEMSGDRQWAYFALASAALLCVLPIFFLAAPGVFFGLSHFLGFHLAQNTLSAVAIKVGYCMAGLFGVGVVSNGVMATSLTQKRWANALVKLMACAFLAGVGLCIISPPVGVGLMLGAPLVAYIVGRISAAMVRGRRDIQQSTVTKAEVKGHNVKRDTAGKLRPQRQPDKANDHQHEDPRSVPEYAGF
jgi:hypothetical protein